MREHDEVADAKRTGAFDSLHVRSKKRRVRHILPVLSHVDIFAAIGGKSLGPRPFKHRPLVKRAHQASHAADAVLGLTLVEVANEKRHDL